MYNLYSALIELQSITGFRERDNNFYFNAVRQFENTPDNISSACLNTNCTVVLIEYHYFFLFWVRVRVHQPTLDRFHCPTLPPPLALVGHWCINTIFLPDIIRIVEFLSSTIKVLQLVSNFKLKKIIESCSSCQVTSKPTTQNVYKKRYVSFTFSDVARCCWWCFCFNTTIQKFTSTQIRR